MNYHKLHLPNFKHINSASASNSSAIPGPAASSHEDFFKQDSMEQRVNTATWKKMPSGNYMNTARKFITTICEPIVKKM
jgi:hypothetical protein